jgi:Iron-containing redox enzyme
MKVGSLEALKSSLGLGEWSHAEFFEPSRFSELHPIVNDVEAYIASVELNRHPFFSLAEKNADALLLWVSQELVMTNAFSQIVLAAASAIRNVHVRSVLAEVAYGEHGRCKHGVAAKSHPWLLDQLRSSVGLSDSSVHPHEATVAFIDRLCGFLHSPLAAIAGIGVGNERLIEPEYAAVKLCFDRAFPAASFRPFLDANLNEDLIHSRLCYEAASVLINTPEDAARFFEYAKESVDSRVRYFDELLLACG